MYQSIVRTDSNQQLIPLKNYIPDILIDLRYATPYNFMHRVLYHHSEALLRRPAARALDSVQRMLRTKGYTLKIWDAYRPYSITEKMWEPVKDDRYAADPHTGSGHNRGIAVDLTIVSLHTGQELDMGTGFDNFTDSAHHNFPLPDSIAANRLLLKTTMEQFGFKALPSEWWHYALPDANRYPLMDVDFRLF